MTNLHIAALAVTFSVYAMLAVSLYGWGKLAVNTFIRRDTEGRLLTTTQTMWLGWAILLFVLQLINLVLPINIYVSVPVFLIGCGYAAPIILKTVKAFLNRDREQKPLSTWVIMAFVVAGVLTISVLTASRAMKLDKAPNDTGLYHFQNIMWLNESRIVLGLGNLSPILAKNPSFFVYVAALNFYPVFNHGTAIANSSLIILTIATLVESAITRFQTMRGTSESHPFQYLPSLLVLPYFALSLFVRNSLAAPHPDTSCTLIQMIIFVTLMESVGDWLTGLKKQDRVALFLMVLSTTAVTMKLSNAMFSFAIVLYVGLYLFVAKSRKLTITLVIIAAIIGGLWVVRGYMYSGVPLYPSSFARLPFDWAMSVEAIDAEAARIYAWSKVIHIDANEFDSGYWWVQTWLEGMAERKHTVVYPFAIFSVSVILMILINAVSTKFRPKLLARSTVIPLIAYSLFWFFTAPDYRYSHALFVVLPVWGVTMLMSTVVKMKKPLVLRTGLVVALVLLLLAYGNYILTYPTVFADYSKNGWQLPKGSELTTATTDTGLVVNVPVKDLRCWSAPLPCAPEKYLPMNLELRNPDDMNAGFRLAEP